MFKAQNLIVIGLVFLLMSQTTQAATATGTLSVSANVASACTVGSGTLNFGVFTPGTKLDRKGNLTITCTKGTSYTIDLDAGRGTGATLSNRVMTNASSPPDVLKYSIYTTTTRTQIWGGGDSAAKVSGRGTGTAQSVDVFGRIFAGQTDVTTGTYTDTVNVTVTF